MYNNKTNQWEWVINVGRSTECFDKEGYLIYEGDIVECADIKGKVFFENGAFKIRTTKGDILCFCNIDISKYKLIGNIYEDYKVNKLFNLDNILQYIK